MKRGIAAALLGILLLTTLTGCAGSDTPDIDSYELIDIAEDELLTQNNTVVDNEAALGQITQKLTDKIRVDTSVLISPTEAEQELITEQVSRIVAALHGKRNGSISDDLLNYLLWEFTKTQYEWELSDTGATILGIDPATRKIFVDVPFETTGIPKLEIQESNIVVGNPLESAYKEARYDDYLEYLAVKFGDSTTSTSSLKSPWSVSTSTEADQEKEAESQKRIEDAKNAFEEKWGSIDVVLEEQQELTLVNRLRNAIKNRDTSLKTIVTDNKFYTVVDEVEGGTQKTSVLPDAALPFIQARGIGAYSYTGITKQTTFNGQAHMTIRFILDFDYNLGAATTITTTSAYVYDYYISGYENALNEMTVSPELESSRSVIAPYVDRLLNSYHKCIEESNYIGLYSLFGTEKTTDDYTGDVLTAISRFADWDKYYVDWNRFAYVNFDAYTYDIRGWEGTTIWVEVTRSKKIRGKGTQMSMPTYEEKVLFTLQVESDDIFVESETILETNITGEPLSMLKDVTGIADKIAYNEQSFSAENEAAVLEALKAFSKNQLTYAVSNVLENQSATTPGSIDLGVGTDAFANIKTTMSNIKDVSEKIVWLGTWSQKSNVYCKVRIREYFRAAGNDIDTEAYVGLANRDGVWTVVSYDRIAASVLNKTDISDKGCLTHDYTDRESTSDYAMSSSSTTQSTESQSTESQSSTNTGTPIEVPVQSQASTSSEALESTAPEDLSEPAGGEDTGNEGVVSEPQEPAQSEGIADGEETEPVESDAEVSVPPLSLGGDE